MGEPRGAATVATRKCGDGGMEWEWEWEWRGARMQTWERRMSCSNNLHKRSFRNAGNGAAKCQADTSHRGIGAGRYSGD